MTHHHTHTRTYIHTHTCVRTNKQIQTYVQHTRTYIAAKHQYSYLNFIAIKAGIIPNKIEIPKVPDIRNKRYIYRYDKIGERMINQQMKALV